MRYIVEEFADISKLAKLVISEKAEWFTIGREHPCKQYSVDSCVESLEEYDLDNIFDKDIQTLRVLEAEGVSYIEF
jgi:hypothetical protein